MNLATATPAEIDTRLVEVEFQLTMLHHQIIQQDRIVGRSEGVRRAAEAGTLQALREKDGKLAREYRELKGEFHRRGGWTRAWVVPGGHVHSSRRCHSLYADTTLILAPRDIRKRDLSGATEEEIVAAAGDRACTHCYPSAPVEPRPSTIVLDEEDDKAKAKAEREAKRAEAAAKKAVKAIANPDGTTIRHDGWNIETESEAQRIYVGTHADAAWNAYRLGAARHEEKKAEVEHLLIAIAHKHGETVEEARDRLAPKVAAKAKRDEREATKHAIRLGLPLNK